MTLVCLTNTWIRGEIIFIHSSLRYYIMTWRQTRRETLRRFSSSTTDAAVTECKSFYCPLTATTLFNLRSFPNPRSICLHTQESREPWWRRQNKLFISMVSCHTLCIIRMNGTKVVDIYGKKITLQTMPEIKRPSLK